MTSSPSRPAALVAGAATIDITPRASVFLYGYPHVPRHSTGVHDPLECAALHLRSGAGAALLLANDLIFVTKELVAETRRRIAAATGVPAHAIMITCTHTHSGPVMSEHLSNASDPVVPAVDPGYLRWLVERFTEAAVAAVKAAVPAELGLTTVRAEGVGSNRHDPTGPTDAQVPVLVARAKGSGAPLACMIVYGMHPTVLHEDSKLLSADFPFFTRKLLRDRALSPACPVLFHQGASGNQSPRHMTRANTFAEAQRLGELLGQTIAAAIPAITFRDDVEIRAAQQNIEPQPRVFPAAAEADEAVEKTRARFERLKREGAPRTDVRTAECDVFGAEETAELARAAIDGRLAVAIAGCRPAEIQAIEVGRWKFVGWPGEFFVEYALELKRRSPDTFLITLANGELQGYVVTAEAAARGVYESTNALFAPANGARFIDATLALLAGNK